MNKVTIVVEPSASQNGMLEIRDAMLQVIDFIDLLSAEGGSDPLRWELVGASTNSPFKAEARAVSVDQNVDITPIARARVQEANEFLDAVFAARRPPKHLGRRRSEAARRLLKRNMNGVGRTIAKMQSASFAASQLLTPSRAAAGLEMLDQLEANEFGLLAGLKARSENGSVEGTFLDVGTDYGKPAFRIEERRSGRKITCRIDDALKDEIAGQSTFADVWNRQRVMVRGKIAFDEDGVVLRVQARSLQLIHSRSMTLNDIDDRRFTGGFSPDDYLQQLREGGLG